MSQSEVERLLDDLETAVDPKDRRKAAQRLGVLGNPETIAGLVIAYNNDSDVGVKRAAEKALRVFRRMEQKMNGIAVDDDDSKAADSPDLVPLLTRARIILVVVLVITFFINGIILIGRAIPPPASPTPTPPVVTARNEIVDAFNKRLNDARAETAALRQLFSGVQGLGMQGVKQEQCQQLAASQLDKLDLLPVDRDTYPDLNSVNDLINIAAQKIVVMRNTYALLCATKDQKQFDDAINAQGGGAALVSRLDAITNQDILAANTALKAAIDKPGPTVGPTYTLVPTATPTLYTNTPIPSATLPPTKTPAVTSTSNAPAATAAATGPATQATTYTFTGLGLDKLAQYKYAVKGSSSLTTTANKILRGSLTMHVARQKDPVVAEYNVSINEGSPTTPLFNLPTLTVAGDSTYVVVESVLYETGSVLTAAKFKGSCRATQATATSIGKLQDITLSELSGITFTAQGDISTVNNVKAAHYSATQNIGDNKELVQTIDVYVSVDKQIPVQVTISRTLDPKVKVKGGLKDYSFSLTYDLTSQGEEALNILMPLACDGVPVK
ncbi:MAG: hypothetical protein ABI947_00615 [Chloroflexota bacterium]